MTHGTAAPRSGPVPLPGARRLSEAVSGPFRPLTRVILALLLIGGLTTTAELALFAPRLQQAWQTVSMLHTARQAMVDQETGVRGFLLAPPPGDRQFLQPYTRGKAEHQTATRQLQTLAPSDTLAKALAVRAQAARTWQSQWAEPAVRDNPVKPGSERFLTEGKALFDEYRQTDAAAARLLDQHTASMLLWQRALAVTSGGIGLLVVGAALLAVRRARQQLLDAVATPLSGIASAVHIGPGGDLTDTLAPTDIHELDALAHDVTSLFTTLSAREAALHAHAHELDVLGAASRALLTDPDPRNAICRAAANIAGAAHAILFEPDGTGHLIDTANLGSPPGQLSLPLTGETNLTVHVFTNHQAVLVDDIHTNPRVAQHRIDGLPPAAGIWLPVLSERHCLGVLVVVLPPAAAQLPASVPASLTVLAGAAAFAIDRVDLHDRLAQQARTDGLTGVANRRTWDDQLPVELARASRTGRPLTVAILDLDHFKAYNDTHGHPAGDQLLRTAARRWHDRLRTTDLLARYGGEEFAVALPDCDLAAAITVLDNLSKQLPDSQTCSVGVAQWNTTESALDLLARADQALYQAKNDGRNRITTAAATLVHL